ncbi:hypothetical protein [Alicyclobacillus dauci]|uniref:DUF5348 domain-containing protein n=1 Tax=Alicyclobacillus dauci TaxID=1475485 RepID=A0ABY6YX04_9BACL|nr:hypothetical protein [Alicyclobacillus dauci]WAH35027.1 hypothetical protein NZD86_11875 [Alicyclobacillus dauci]
MTGFKLELSSKREYDIAVNAVNEYRRLVQQHEQTTEFLESKQFHMGDYIIKKGTSYFDGVFGTGEGEIGKIVGWDFEYGYYRVYYSERMNFVGVREEKSESYAGEIPVHLLRCKPFEPKRLWVNVGDSE